ncbi:uncharacterized protein LOC135386132 [Ornithodoros turicata]|uniref:uncharacterized protein LOC135374756 n=1 Tax=Ornithodoros turicata TaxID=34597 RepID=UPI00313A230A
MRLSGGPTATLVLAVALAHTSWATRSAEGGGDSTNWLSGTRRDENEGVENRPRAPSVGFYIGDPCNLTCSQVLHNVFCNTTSRKCECRAEHPVNIENRQCVKASPLGVACGHDEACTYIVEQAVCRHGKCRCKDGHEPQDGTRCVPARGVAILDNAELTTMISVIASLVIFTALFCLVLRLFSKARFGSTRDRMGDAGAPTSVLDAAGLEEGALNHHRSSLKGPPSRRTSRASVDYSGGQRRSSYAMLAPPSNPGSRRASSSSVRSQASLRSAASTRSGSISLRGGGSHHGGSRGCVTPGSQGSQGCNGGCSSSTGGRDPVRRTVSSPADASSTQQKNHQQPIARPLHLHLSQLEKEDSGYDTVVNHK